MKKKSLLVLGLIAILTISAAAPVFADDADQAAIAASIDELENRKQELLGQIDGLEAELVTTIAGVDAINTRLAELAVEMDQTAADLKVAEAEKVKQHDAMKTRIQYIYEQGGDAGWIKIFLSNGDITSWLNDEEYTKKIYDYDRSMLQAYSDACDAVKVLQAQQQSQKVELEKKKNSLKEGQQKLEGLLVKAKEEYDDYDAKIADAYAKAIEYQAIITAQNDSISQMVALQMAAAGFSEAAYEAGETPYNFEDLSEAEQQEMYEAAEELAVQMGTDVGSAQQVIKQAYEFTGNNSSSFGQSVIDFAAQFLGNPYVYGGNSLTNGVDCSGFVQQVYGNFGIETPRSSWDLEVGGEQVSYNDVQPGDVVCYDGHVGLYAGDGMIINAADEEHGIIYTPVDYMEIRDIRRYN